MGGQVCSESQLISSKASSERSFQIGLERSGPLAQLIVLVDCSAKSFSWQCSNNFEVKLALSEENIREKTKVMGI